MSGSKGSHSHQSYGFDKKTAERMYKDYKSHKSSSHHHGKKKKSLLDDLFG